MIKKFENYMSREEMCGRLCRCGYNMNELEKCSNQELEEMCRNAENEEENNNTHAHAMTHESKKTLKGLKEHQETQNYMFFASLQTIKRLVDGMLEMDESKVDRILSDGHNWALDHIATSKDDVEEVFNFLASHESDEDNGYATHDTEHNEPSHEETEGNLANKDLESEMKGIKSFNDFKK